MQKSAGKENHYPGRDEGGRDMSIFKGAAVAIITPMQENREINYPKLAQILDDQIANHTDAIVICGTTGESSTLTHEEHLEAIRFTVEHVAGRVPVIAGTGSNCTETAIYLSTEAERYGADALLVVTPYYNKATQKGLIAHYTAIAEAVSLPIIMYNVPSRTGCNIQPETAAYLAKNVKNIVGIKEASGNISQIAKLMELAGDQIELYSGNDDQVVPILSLGGLGVISVLSNVAPQQTHDMVMRFLEGDVAGSREIQLKALPLIDALFCEVNPIPVKAAMNMMGWEAGPLRMPLTEMEPEHKERLKKAMIDFGIEVK
jgi:4-hydroxy-tetrahydrodipicolinate synthase